MILVAVDVGIYNVRKATCGNVCYTCDGYGDWQAELNPFLVGANKQYTVSLSAAYDNGSRYNFAATWTSSNKNVMTVVSNTGTTTGVNIGSATVGGPVANLQSPPVYVPDVCTQSGDPCPLGFGGGGQANGNTTPSVSFSSISNLQVGQTGTISATLPLHLTRLLFHCPLLVQLR